MIKREEVLFFLCFFFNINILDMPEVLFVFLVSFLQSKFLTFYNAEIRTCYSRGQRTARDSVFVFQHHQHMCEKIRGKRVLKVAGLFGLVGTKEKLLGNCLIFSSFSFYPTFFLDGRDTTKNRKLTIYLWQFIIVIYGLECQSNIISPCKILVYFTRKNFFLFYTLIFTTYSHQFIYAIIYFI